MTIALKHGFTSTKSDDPAAVTAGKVLPSHWNADHTLTQAGERILGKADSGNGNTAELTLTQVLDLATGTAAQGDILYRNATGWVLLAAGTSGQLLTTKGTGNDPVWEALVAATAQLADESVTYAKMQHVSATSRILGRKTAAAGDPEECTLSEILDFVGSAAQGDILFRTDTGWTRLGAGTSGQFLQTQGTGANPQWANNSAVSGSPAQAPVYAETNAYTSHTTGITVPYDDTKPTTSETVAILTPADVTGTSTSNFWEIEGQVQFALAGSGSMFYVCLFKDSDTTATRTAIEVYPSNSRVHNVGFKWRIPVADTNATSWDIRVGSEGGTNIYINGDDSLARMDDTLYTWVKVTEVKG